jgi:endogenous inhibitor of DNA gyrase (YacG/DUF329 family)
MPPRPEPPKGEGKGERKSEGKGTRARKVRACPICRAPADEATLPFCSPRCRDVDLNRWFSGTYVVPGSENDEEDEK